MEIPTLTPTCFLPPPHFFRASPCRRAPPRQIRTPRTPIITARTSRVKDPTRRRPHPPRNSPSQTRLQPLVKRGRGGPAESARQALRARRDLLIVGHGLPAKLSAVLSARERAEDALVLLPTRSEVERAAKEIDLDRRGAVLIVCSGGHGGSSWAFPDVNANSARKNVIVVGTPRSVAARFCASAHGRPWLARVSFFVLVDPDAMVESSCMKEMRRVLKPMKPAQRRKNCVVAIREPKDKAVELVDRVMREAREVVKWEGVADKTKMVKNEVLEGIGVEGKRQIVAVGSHKQICGELVDVLRKQMEREGKRKVVAFFATTRLAECYAELVRAQGLDVSNVSPKRTFGKNIRVLERFCSEDKGIVFASDSLTRDGSLPDVDCVMQVGLPQTKEQYLRRVAMVAEGEDRYALLLLANLESEVAIRELELPENVERREIETGNEWQPPGNHKIWSEADMSKAYESWLAYYRHCRKRMEWTRPQLVEHANIWAEKVLGRVPALEKTVIDRLHLRGTAGLEVEAAKA